MELTVREEAMLNGEEGEGTQSAMRLLVDVGDFFGAERLVPVSSVHVSGVSYFTGGDALIEHLQFFVSKQARISVPATLNPCGMDLKHWESTGIQPNFAEKQFEILGTHQESDTRDVWNIGKNGLAVQGVQSFCDFAKAIREIFDAGEL